MYFPVKQMKWNRHFRPVPCVLGESFSCSATRMDMFMQDVMDYM